MGFVEAATREGIRTTALKVLDLPAVADAHTFEIHVTCLAERAPDAATLEGIGRVLGVRAREAMVEQAGGRTLTGVTVDTVDWSDHADCEDLHGKIGSAFDRGERCYRMVLLVAAE